jgi:hypothetical protein
MAGFRACEGTEANIFACPERGNPTDRDCTKGCLGDDGYQGTLDDTIDPSCVHSLDQGAICHSTYGPPTPMKLPNPMSMW